jgi:hypothetical protein
MGSNNQVMDSFLVIDLLIKAFDFYISKLNPRYFYLFLVGMLVIFQIYRKVF